MRYIRGDIMASAKDRIHAILLNCTGYISGEEISKELGISRQAVNAAVKLLKEDGCDIESVTNKGYRLIKNCEKLCAGTIISKLKAEREGNITVLETVDSTNTYLRSMLQKKIARVGDCVIANTQTGGRGRLGRSFSSPANMGVYLSYCINPKGAQPQEISQITAWICVAVREAILECFGIESGIKWVNDLVFDGKKLCGILTEMSVVGESGEASDVVAGIGVNVNQMPQDFPKDVADIATSIKMIRGKDADRARLCAMIINKLDKLCSDFPKEKAYYLSEYRKNCAVIGKKVRTVKNGDERTGTAIGVDENFGLIIDFDDGVRETVTGGEVSVRGFYGYI